MKTSLLDDPLDNRIYPVRPTWMVLVEVFLLAYTSLFLLMYALILAQGMINNQEDLGFLVVGLLFGLPPSLFFWRLWAWRKASKLYLKEEDPIWLLRFGPKLLVSMPLVMSSFWALGSLLGWEAIWDMHSPVNFILWVLCSFLGVLPTVLCLSVVQVRRQALGLHQLLATDA